MHDLERLREWASEGARLSRAGHHLTNAQTMSDLTDALLAAWEALGNPCRWIGSPINRWQCRHCATSSPGAPAAIQHGDDCPYGIAQAALRELIGGGDAD